MNPGSTLFIRILSGAYLSAKSLVNAASPARNTPDVGKAASGSNTAYVEILMINPDLCFRMMGVTRRVGRITFRK